MDAKMLDEASSVCLDNIKLGLKLYDIAHNQGFKEAFEEKLESADVNYDSIGTLFEYTYFVGSIYSTDVTRYLQSFMALALSDEKAQQIFSMFQINIEQLLKVCDEINGMANRNLNSTNIKESSDIRKHIQVEGAIIGKLINVDEILLPMIQIITDQNLVVDGANELLNAMKEFVEIYDKLIELYNTGR